MIKNSIKYNFNDFTTKNYRNLIQKAKKKYTFSDYHSFNKNKKIILWRHDVDFSVHRALKFAKIDNDEGIIATYFFLLHSKFYNLLEKEITDLVIEIINLGQEIGIHFDTHYYNIKSEEDLKYYLNFEKLFFNELFKKQIKVFSFHILDENILSLNAEKYAGLINVYSEHFQNKVDYCSDSNGYWQYERFEDVLDKNNSRSLQVLTHPSLWQDTVMSPRERVWKCIDGRTSKTKKWYNDTLEFYNRKNI